MVGVQDYLKKLSSWVVQAETEAPDPQVVQRVEEIITEAVRAPHAPLTHPLCHPLGGCPALLLAPAAPLRPSDPSHQHRSVRPLLNECTAHPRCFCCNAIS
jgi:hypothetical protein